MRELFDEVMRRWPEAIDARRKTPLPDGHFRVEGIVDVHDEIRASLPQDDDLLLFVDWAIFAEVWEMAQSSDEVKSSDISVINVRARVLEYLREPENAFVARMFDDS